MLTSLYLLLVLVLLRLPFLALVGLVSFLIFTLLLKHRHHVIAKLVMLLVSSVVIFGLLYGSLRFAGVITYAIDREHGSTAYCTWFDTPYQQDAYPLIHFYGSVLIGRALAIWREKKAHRAEETSGLQEAGHSD